MFAAVVEGHALPSGHGVQRSCAPALKVPAGQAVIETTLASDTAHAKPAAQAVQFAAPASEYVPGTHVMRTALTVEGQAKPAAQGVHAAAPPSA